MSMYKRSVLLTGVEPGMTTEALGKLCAKIGELEKTAFVIGTDGKPTGRAYAVYKSAEFAAQAALRLTSEVVKCEVLQSETDEFQMLFGEEPDTSARERLRAAFLVLSAEEQQQFLLEFGPAVGGAGPGAMAPEQPGDRLKVVKKEPQDGASASTFMAPVGTLPGLVPDSTAGNPAIAPNLPQSPFYGSSGVPVMVQEGPKLPLFSGTPGKDSSFARWKWEVKSCMASKQYPNHVLLTGVRKSLRSPAADSLTHMPATATAEDILAKLECVYGTVMPGQTLLKKFWSEPQKGPKEEDCAQWSLRLEGLCYEAAEKNAITHEAVPGTLTVRFWDGLYDERIKNALRPKKDELTFEEMVKEARMLEEEYQPVAESKNSVSHAQVVSDPRLDLLLKKMEQLEKKIQHVHSSQQTQSKPTTQNPEVPTCGKCKRKGHIGFGCRQGVPNLNCHRCMEPGHISASCRNELPGSSLNHQ